MLNYGLPDLSKCQLWSDTELGEDILLTYDQATNFMSSKAWCLGIRESYVGIMHPGFVSVFLFRVDSTRQDLPEWAWVIVGNLPHTCLAIEDKLTPSLALASYVKQLKEWAAAASENRTIDNMEHLSIPATPEWGEAINRTVAYLDRILDDHKRDFSP